MKFYIKHYSEQPKEYWELPGFILVPNSWDDYGFQTTFTLFYYDETWDREEIGEIKILDKNSNTTILDEEFDRLQNNFVSLGQTIEYYLALKKLVGEDFNDIVKKLNDAAFSKSFRNRFENLDGFKKSLLRSSEAERLLNDAKTTILDRVVKRTFVFNFRYKIPNAVTAHVIDFDFSKNHKLPNRFFCLIGKNGTGKTKLLSQLVIKLTDRNEDGDFIGSTPLFSKIIAISFSFFDDFKLPLSKDVSYDFIGIRDEEGMLEPKQLMQEVWNSFKLLKAKGRYKFWEMKIKSVLNEEQLSFEIEDFSKINERKAFYGKIDEVFSSGQKIVFHIITRLIAKIEINSLIAFDEPETHLHPNIIGKLLNSLNSIFKKYDSYCIVSTHSPIIVQQIPSKFVRVLSRIDNTPIISRPITETFGENYSILFNSIFQVDKEREIYKDFLETISSKKNYEEINALFDGKLSLNGRLFIQMKNK